MIERFIKEMTKMVAIAALVFASCAKLDDLGGGRLVKVFDVGYPEAVTRSSIDGYAVSWAVADKLYYVTNNTDGAQSHTMAAAAASTKVSVNYKDGDTKCVFFTAGNNTTTAVASASLSAITLTNGIPASQDGTFAGYHISAATAGIQGSAAVAMVPLQAYVKFKLSDLVVGDKTVNKIKITDAASTKKNICGTVKITPSGTVGGAPSISFEGSGTGYQTITIDKTQGAFTKDAYYYVAMRPAVYGSGIKFSLCNGDTEVGTVTTKACTLATKKITDLQALNGHKKVDAGSVSIYPKFSAFTRLMTKELFVAVEPSDFTGTITWSSSDTGIIPISTTSGSENPKYIRDEIKDGVTYKVYRVNTADLSSNADYSADALGEVTLTCQLRNGTSTDAVAKSATTRIKVGLFVDLGIINGKVHTLWGVGNMTGKETTPTPATGLGDISSLHMFDPDNATDLAKGSTLFSWGSCRGNTSGSNYNQWGGSMTLDSGDSGGKYNSTDKLETLQKTKPQSGYPTTSPLNRVDDPVSLWKGGESGSAAYHTFSPSDWSSLASSYYTEWEAKETKYGYSTCRKIKGKRWGYRDMYFYLYHTSNFTTDTRGSGDARMWSQYSAGISSPGATQGGYKTNGYCVRPVWDITITEEP